MNKDKHHDELLVEIANRMNMHYLSDLGAKIRFKELKVAIDKIPETKYDVQEWQEAVNYLTYRRTNEKNSFASVEEAKHYLLNMYA